MVAQPHIGAEIDDSYISNFVSFRTYLAVYREAVGEAATLLEEIRVFIAEIGELSKCQAERNFAPLGVVAQLVERISYGVILRPSPCSAA